MKSAVDARVVDIWLVGSPGDAAVGELVGVSDQGEAAEGGCEEKERN